MKSIKELRKDRDDSICRMAKEQGLSYRQIAKIVDLSHERVHQIFRSRYPHPGVKIVDAQ